MQGVRVTPAGRSSPAIRAGRVSLRDDRQDGLQAEGLLDHRVGVRVVGEALPPPRKADEALHRPGQRGRRRLVARDEQRDELVAQLALVHPRGHEHGQDVLALGEAGIEAGEADLLVEGFVDGSSTERKSPSRSARSGPRIDRDTSRRGSVVNSSISRSRARRRSSRPASRTPKIVRMTISSVTSCIRGQTENGAPGAQRANSASATSRMISS